MHHARADTVRRQQEKDVQKKYANRKSILSICNILKEQVVESGGDDDEPEIVNVFQPSPPLQSMPAVKFEPMSPEQQILNEAFEACEYDSTFLIRHENV